MRTLSLFAVVLLVPSLYAAELSPLKLELDATGTLTKNGKVPEEGSLRFVRYTVLEVGKDWLAIEIEGDFGFAGKVKTATMIVRGIPTRGIVDGKPWEPTGNWTVTDTEKYKGSTVFVLRMAVTKK